MKRGLIKCKVTLLCRCNFDGKIYVSAFMLKENI